MFIKEKCKKVIDRVRAENPEYYKNKSDYAIWRLDKKQYLREAKSYKDNKQIVYDIDYKDFRKVMEEYNF